jgi:hypothetical protein
MSGTHQSRWIYLAVGLSVAVPFLVNIQLKMPISRAAQSTYESVENLSQEMTQSGKRRWVLIAADWAPATMAENNPQVLAFVHHLMSRSIPFAILGFDLQGPPLAEELSEKAAAVWDKTYGQDWCNWGYRLQIDTTLTALVTDFSSIVKEDYRGTAIKDLPVMEGFQGMQDIGLIAEFTGSSGYLDSWVQFVHAKLGTPIVHGCTGVMESTAYPLLDSGQLSGLLAGLSGAAQYEQLVQRPGTGSKGMAAQSMAQLLIIGLIVAANIIELRRRSRWNR